MKAKLYRVDVIRIDGEKLSFFAVGVAAEQVEEYVLDGKCDEDLISVRITLLSVEPEDIVVGGEVPDCPGWWAGWVRGEALTYRVLSPVNSQD